MVSGILRYLVPFRGAGTYDHGGDGLEHRDLRPVRPFLLLDLMQAERAETIRALSQLRVTAVAVAHVVIVYVQPLAGAGGLGHIDFRDVLVAEKLTASIAMHVQMIAASRAEHHFTGDECATGEGEIGVRV
jgi:hypothetical protein